MNLSVHEKTIQRTLSSGFALLNLGNVSTAVTTSFTDSSAKIQYDNIAKNCVALANGGTLAGIKSANMPSSGLPTSNKSISMYFFIYMPVTTTTTATKLGMNWKIN